VVTVKIGLVISGHDFAGDGPDFQIDGVHRLDLLSDCRRHNTTAGFTIKAKPAADGQHRVKGINQPV
jgi:hypothetical protein